MMYRHLGALLRCHVTWRMRLLLRHKHDSQSTRINTRTHGKTRTSLLGTMQEFIQDLCGALLRSGEL
jgi:hypothetical protein